MRFTETMSLPGDPRSVARMYADPEYAEVRSGVLGAHGTETAVDGDVAGSFTVSTRRRVPSASIPQFARTFVGSELEVREIQSWGAPEADGSRSGSMTVEIVGVPASVQASASLSAAPGGSSVTLTGDIRASVPLIGGRLEKAAVPYVSKILRSEERSAAQYLADG